MKCPNCNSEVKESELMPSLLTDSLLCCQHCKGKSKHFVVGGTDPTIVFNQAQEKIRKMDVGSGKEEKMINPTCDICHKELDDFGALLFSPPNEKGQCKKWHICKGCYERKFEKRLKRREKCLE